MHFPKNVQAYVSREYQLVSFSYIFDYQKRYSSLTSQIRVTLAFIAIVVFFVFLWVVLGYGPWLALETQRRRQASDCTSPRSSQDSCTCAHRPSLIRIGHATVPDSSYGRLGFATQKQVHVNPTMSDDAAQ